MQEHLQYQEALYCGFAPFLARHAPDIIALVSDPIGEEEADLDDDVLGGPIEEPPAASSLSPLQVDRLGFLFKVESDSGEPGVGPGGSQGGGAAAEPRPMDEDTSPFNPSAHSKSQPGNARLSEALSSLWGADGTVPVTSVAAWIRESLAGAGPHRDTSFDPMMGTSPPRISMFNQLAPSIPTMIERWDVYAVHKATAVRGESDLPGGSVRVVDCHDAVVYCLAPLQYATITCCTDCIVVLGAVGKAVRVERCERIQVIAAACSVTVNTCHDCIFYLGVNRPPLLLGDNRFLQFAPHNAPYERLPEHLAASGVLPTPNAWNMHVQLLPDHSKHHHAPLHSSSPSPKVPSPLSQMAAMETEGSASGTSGSNQPPCATLLPPEKLMPFLVPFQGGRGPLCGGPALPNRDTGSSDDTISGLLTHGDAGAAAFSRCPFPLPAEYAAAWEAKTSGVASVRAAYREAHLDEARKREFMAAIQTQFKEWLQAGGGMREVYDLAKLEKERRAESMAAGSNDVI